jgi:hypothetical protein
MDPQSTPYPSIQTKAYPADPCRGLGCSALHVRKYMEVPTGALPGTDGGALASRVCLCGL